MKRLGWETKITSSMVGDGPYDMLATEARFNDKEHRNGNSFMLKENDKIVVDDKLVANIFNDDYFCNIVSKIGFDDPITTTHDVIKKHRDHPSVLKIRETYSIEADSFSFSCVDENVVTSKLRSIKINE